MSHDCHVINPKNRMRIKSMSDNFTDYNDSLSDLLDALDSMTRCLDSFADGFERMQKEISVSPSFSISRVND